MAGIFCCVCRRACGFTRFLFMEGGGLIAKSLVLIPRKGLRIACLWRVWHQKEAGDVYCIFVCTDSILLWLVLLHLLSGCNARRFTTGAFAWLRLCKWLTSVGVT